MKAAVVGMGSIGKRHFLNLKSLNVDVVGVDLDDVIPFDVDFAVISTPTNTHVEIADRYLSEDIPIFVEKPMSESLSELDYIQETAKKSSAKTMVACNIRFTDAVRTAFLDSEFVDPKLFHAKIFSSHPRRGKYGHIALEDIHELDYLHWLFGEIESFDFTELHDDSYTAVAKFDSGVTGKIQGNSTSPKYVREFRIDHRLYPIEPNNEMYVKEMQYFINCLKLGLYPMNSIGEACKTTRFILEALRRHHCSV